MLLRKLLPLACVLAGAALPAQAAAGPALDVGIADDRVLLHGTDLEVLEAVSEWQRLGVDTVRIQARWVAHVPDPLKRRRPSYFRQSDPDSRGYNWGALDRAVNAVAGAGMEPLLTVTGSGPLWGVRNPRQGNPRHKPSPASFAQFATAVARRYGDRVDEYLIWNEPNHELWLQPQNTCKRTRRSCRPYAPHLYRRIVRAADPAIRRADPGARTMMGALAPKGTSGRARNARLRPLRFIREMGCVTRRFQKRRRGRCRGFKPASTYGFAYHPHGITDAPSDRAAHRDDAQFGDLRKVVRTIDRTARRGGLRTRHPSGRFPLYLDEHGYETSPPDRRRGISFLRQSTYLQQAAFLAWSHPRVRNLTQYAWRDEPMRARDGAGWQSGLRRLDGTAKPALRTFPHPFWAVRRSRRVVRLWGQVRPGGSHTVELQRRTSRGWRTLTRVGTDPRGAFRRDIRTRSGGRYRFRWAFGTSSTRRVR